MKKLMICTLITTLISANIVGASAATINNNTINLSLENIEEIMLSNSPDMKIADNNLKRAEEDYDDFNDEYDSNLDRKEDLVEDLEDERDNVNKPEIDTNAGTSDTNKGNTKRDSHDIKEDLKEAKKGLREFKKGKEIAKYNLKAAKLQYDKTVKQSVLTTQKTFIEYLSSLSQKDIAQKNLTTQNRQSDVAKMKYEMGFISQKEYNSKGTGSTDFSNTLQELIKKQETDLKNLHLSLGIPLTKQIIITNDVNVDIDKVSKIKFQEDLDELLKNNISIKIKDIESEKTDKLDKEYDIDNAEISLKQEKENAKLAFEKQYNTLINSCNTLKASNTKLNEKQNDFTTIQNKYNYGFVSKKQVDDLETELDKQKSEFVSEKNNFYVNYLQYLQMKEGY